MLNNTRIEQLDSFLVYIFKNQRSNLHYFGIVKTALLNQFVTKSLSYEGISLLEHILKKIRKALSDILDNMCFSQ